MWSYEHLYLTCFCLFQSHNLASIFVPTKTKLLIISMVYFRGGQVMPKGKHIIDYKQKRAAHWAARFLRLWDFVTTISTARRNFSFLWLDWIELLDSMGDAWRGT